MSHPGDDAPDGADPQAPKPKRKRASKAVALAQPSAPAGLPALFERAAAASNFDVDALTKLMALKREIEADEARRRFDREFAALQAEIGRVTANAYDPQKRRSYADLNALVDAVAPLAAVRGFTITYDTEPSAVPGCVKVTMKIALDGAANKTSVDVPLDGAGTRGGANMSLPQAHCLDPDLWAQGGVPVDVQFDRGHRECAGRASAAHPAPP
jgi:hypothetical protein